MQDDPQPTQNKKREVSIKLTLQEYEQIEEIAQRECRTIPNMMKYLLQKYLKENCVGDDLNA